MKKRTNLRLTEERKFHQWSQQEVADRIGTTQHNVSRWERGATTPNPYFRTKLCELFDKSEEALGLTTRSPLPPTTTERETPEVVQTGASSAEELKLWMVPYPRNPHFTGRDELLHQLDQQLSQIRPDDVMTARRAALTQPQAIKGLGGVGKTQIAVEYAYRSQEQGLYTYTFWVSAANEEAIMASFAAIAELLPSFAEKEEKDRQKLVAAIKHWLEQCEQHWLLIFDNADDIALVQGYFPKKGNGSLLLTTRMYAVGSLAASVEVEQMGVMEGTQLLLHRAQYLQATEEERNEAANVVIALDGFPLAIDQAGAYIEETRCSFGDYLQIYQRHRKILLARRGTQATSYPDSVATTWLLSFQEVEQANPAAAELLQLCAFLAPDHIPEELLKEGAPFWPPLLQQATTDLFAFNQMLEDLLTFSLIKRLVGDRLLSIHRLVQAVQIDRIELEEQRQWAERVVRSVNAVFPHNPEKEVATWPLSLRYLEQAQACDTLIQQHQLTIPEAADVLERTASYLFQRASYTLAETLFQRAAQIWEQQEKPEYFRAATALRELGTLYSERGEYTKAETFYQRALYIHEQQPVPEHFQLAKILNGLGSLYRKQGRYAEAEPLLSQVVHIQEQQLGPEHLQVAYPLYNLALLYTDLGKYSEAEPIYQRALRIREQELGPEHLLVAYPVNGLAILCAELRRYQEAEALFRRVLHIWEQQLGPEHPLVAYPLNNLAELHYDQGKYEEVEGLYLRVLSIREQQWGPDHPQVAHPLTGLANLYRTQGKYMEAEALFQRALSLRERHLEANHPDIAKTLHDFALLREAEGKLPEAALLYRRALAIRRYVYGTQHLKTVDTRDRLRSVLLTQGQAEEAAQLDEIQPEAVETKSRE